MVWATSRELWILAGGLIPYGLFKSVSFSFAAGDGAGAGDDAGAGAGDFWKLLIFSPAFFDPSFYFKDWDLVVTPLGFA